MSNTYLTASYMGTQMGMAVVLRMHVNINLTWLEIYRKRGREREGERETRDLCEPKTQTRNIRLQKTREQVPKLVLKPQAPRIVNLKL